MPFNNGNIYYLQPCNASIPKKPKYVVCISVEEGFFYLINSCEGSRPYKHELENAVYLEPHQVKCLKHRSYINVAKPVYIDLGDYKLSRKYELLSNATWLSIKTKAFTCKLLQKRYRDIINNAKK